MGRMLQGLRAIHRDPGLQLGLFALCAMLVCTLPGFNIDRGLDCIYEPDGCLGDLVVSLTLLLVVTCAALWGGVLARGGFVRGPIPLSRAKRWLAVIAMLGLAAVTRFWKLGDIPQFLDYDTAQNGWIGLTLWEQLADNGVQWVLREWATGNEAAYLYVVGLSLKTLGVTPAALRLPSAMVGLATVALIYLLGKQLFSARLGLLAGTLAALLPGHIEHSRMATRPILTPLFVAAGLLFLARALSARAEANPRHRWLNLVLCGVVIGLGLHGYEASRLFPLAVTTALLWHRFAQRRPLRGLIELAAVAAVALVITAPILLFAWQHPEEYLQHVSTSSILHQMQDEGSVLPLLRNARNTLVFLLLGLPINPNIDFPLVLPLLTVPLCFACGLVGLVLCRRSDPDDQHAPAPAARVLLLSTLVWMAAPFLLSRFGSLTVRRYFGELVPLCLVAGGAGLAVLRQFWICCRPSLRIAAVIVALVVPVAAVYSTWEALDDPDRGTAVDPHDELVLRHGLAQAKGAEVYLAPGRVKDSYISKLFFKNKRLKELPLPSPLPLGALDREVVLLATDEPWGPTIRSLFNAQGKPLQWIVPGSFVPVRLQQFRLPGAVVAGQRLEPTDRAVRQEADLIIPDTGVYRFRFSGRKPGQLGLDGAAVRLVPEAEGLSLPLAAGVHRLVFHPGDQGDRLHWSTPESEEWEPIPAGFLWRFKDRTTAGIPQPPACRTTAALTPLVQHHVSGDPAYEHSRILQDIAPAKRGLLIADLDRLVVRRWTAAQGVLPAAVLFDGDGEPLENPPSYTSDWSKVLSLDHSDRGSWILHRWHLRVQRFGPSGKLRQELSVGLHSPLDLAEDRGRLYIADPGRKAVMVTDAHKLTPPRMAVLGVRPVAVDAAAGTLAYLDQRRHQLVLRRPTGRITVALAAVNWQMRLSLTEDGRAVITDPVKNQVLLFDAAGRLIAPGGDPLAVTNHPEVGPQDIPRAAAWDSRSDELVLLMGAERLIRLTVRGR